jgi:hypothetical protein
MIGLLAAVLLSLPGLTAFCADSTSVIGGNAIIPINPDFSPSTALQAVNPATGEFFLNPDGTPVDFLNNPVANLLDLNQSLQVQIEVPVALGAALSQAISAGNRPSVLTPYSGILYGVGEDAVFDSFGSLVTNKASTLGKGKLGIGLSYQHAVFDQFDGHEIGKTINQDIRSSEELSGSVVQPAGTFGFATIEPFETVAKIRARDVEFKADVITLSLTYGLLDNLDIGALVPYVVLQTSGEVEIKVRQSINIQPSLNGTDLPVTLPARSDRTFKGSFDRDFDGLGDIILFTKWQLFSQYDLPNKVKGPVDLALQGEVKLATGDDARFLGTGNTDGALRVLLQRELAGGLRLRGELGYNYSGLGSEFSTWEYKAGGEWELRNNLAASAELIGSYSREFGGVVDVAAGAKWSVSNDFKIFAGVRAPLNDNGLRYSYSPIFGVEYVFSRPPAMSMDDLEMEPMGLDPVGEAPASGEPMRPVRFEPQPVDPSGPSAAGLGADPFAVSSPAMPAVMTPQGEPLRLEPVVSKHVVGENPAVVETGSRAW